MFEPVAVELLKLMGATGRVPGALMGADVPPALARLETAIDRITMETHGQTSAPPADNEDSASDDADDKAQESPVAIAVRAIPLLSLLKRAAAANAEVVWEGS